MAKNVLSFHLFYLKTMKISIQGNLGSYSHLAAAKIFGKKINILERENFDQVFEDLKSGEAKYILVPIENSTHGSVYQNYDNLTKNDFPIVAEIYLKINFHLIGNLGANLDNIDELYSHPVGLNQIKEFTKQNPQIKVKQQADTAGAVKYIKDKGLINAAAAASEFAAELYDMQILKRNIQENSKNYTRFFVLTDRFNMEIPTYNLDMAGWKTTVQFRLGTEAGSLYKSLRCFADRDIPLSKIESRPIINTDWEYMFYVDIIGSVDNDKTKNALKEMEDYVRELKVLGCYKLGKYIET